MVELVFEMHNPSGMTPGAGRKRSFSHVIASQKVEKWRKSGYNPPKTGSGGRLTSMLFKGGVELIIKMHYPSGVTPGASSKSRFSLKKIDLTT